MQLPSWVVRKHHISFFDNICCGIPVSEKKLLVVIGHWYGPTYQ